MVFKGYGFPWSTTLSLFTLLGDLDLTGDPEADVFPVELTPHTQHMAIAIEQSVKFIATGDGTLYPAVACARDP